MKEIDLKDLKEIKKTNIFSGIIFFISFTSGGFLFLIKTISILLLDRDNAYITSEGIIAMLVFSIFFIGIGMFFLKLLIKDMKVRYNINELIIEEDYVYDREEKHISLKINGTIFFGNTSGINKNDVIYVVKNVSSNKIINTYRKNDTMLSNELKQIVKTYDHNYINEKFNQQIEIKKQNFDFMDCKNCNEYFDYNEEKGICPKCHTANAIELKDLMDEKEWY